MRFDWLKSIRGVSRRRLSRQLQNAAIPLECRTLLSATAVEPEIQVNSFTTGIQTVPAISMDADGDFVVTWTSYGQDGSDAGIFTQRYNSEGIPQGSEFKVNSYTTGRQSTSAIAMNAEGDFVIVWESSFQDGSSEGVFGQRYDAAGVPQGIEFRVNNSTSGGQLHPAIGMDADGDFVVTWTSYGQDGSGWGIYAQRFNPLGVPQGGEFQVNSFTTSAQIGSEIAMDANGDFVITWHGFDQENGFGTGIYAQRFNAAGVPQGQEFHVNTYTWGNQTNPAIGMDADGDFVITWNSMGADGSGYGIYAQRYNPAGVAQGTEFRVNSYTTGHQHSSSIRMDADGDFVVTWSSSGQGEDYFSAGIYAQRYNAAGERQGGEFRVNSYNTGNQLAPVMGMDAVGDFVICWQSVGQDGSAGGIYAQRYLFTENGAPILNANGSPTLDSIQLNALNSENPGTPISVIIARMAPDGGISDPNAGEFLGIAINGLGGTATGTWQFTIDGGANWAAIGTTGNSNARLLAADSSTRIRYVPNPGFHGEVKIAYVAWDQTTGSNGGVANVGTRGGTTPFSLTYEYASLQVVNYAPVIISGGAPTLDAIQQNVADANNPGTLVSEIIARLSPYGYMYDSNPNTSLGIAINGLGGTATGTWEYTVNGGTNWTPFSVSGNVNARLLAGDPNTRIRYVPATGFLGEVKLAFVAWDRSAGTNGGVANVSQRGGNTPFSAVYEYASLLVLNSAPVLTVSGTSTLDAIPADVLDVNNPGTLVSTLISRMGPSGGMSDPDPAALSGIAINGLGGTANGTWQYTIDGGTSWTAIGTTGNSNARLLAADNNTRIRFVPNTGFTGSVKLAFVAWDQTTGVNGGTLNVGSRGGTTAFSLLYDYASISIS